MNNLIRQFAKESHLDVYGLGKDHVKWESCLEKFAELIVQECIAIVDNAERGGSNEIWDNAVKFIRRDLKQHFGVEL